MGKSLAAQLEDFDVIRLNRDQCLVGWKEIAWELGVSEDTLQRWCAANSIRFRRWGPREASPVFLPRSKIAILKALYFS